MKIPNFALGTYTNFDVTAPQPYSPFQEAADWPQTGDQILAQLGAEDSLCPDCAAKPVTLSPQVIAAGVGLGAFLLMKKGVVKSAMAAVATLLIATLWTKDQK